MPTLTIAIHTNALDATNGHLMPWRTVLEVARHLRQQGTRTVVLNGGMRVGRIERDGCTVIDVRKPVTRKSVDAYLAVLKENGVERVYFPVAPGPLPRCFRSLPSRAGIPWVWYMPGSWYGGRQLLVASRHLPLRAVFPYWLQVAWPKRLWALQLLQAGERPLIAHTSFTARRLVDSGYPEARIRVIPPGQESRNAGSGRTEQFQRLAPKLAGEPYFLFFGPPNPIRGVCQLLDAFAHFARKSPTGRLVCLFRADANVDPGPVRRCVERMDLPDRLLVVWESVGAADRHAFLEHCHAVVKPFLLVPSEIPLAVIEAMSHGKPVIGCGPDGTGEWIERFGLTSRHGDARGLAEAMKRLATDERFYQDCCRQARTLAASHPGWDAVAARWLREPFEQVEAPTWKQ